MKTTTSAGRIGSIDAFRAVTMLLMIWVNDFWTLIDIPESLKHMPAADDALGFSDIIFPLFLFIVGLSMPYSIAKRLKSQSRKSVIIHILIRTASLLIMGVFLVNLENIQPDAMLVPKALWQFALIVAFFLIWNDYREWQPRIRNGLMGAGIVLLLILALLYKGGAIDAPIGMKTYWWGILGLIGWAYFTVALLFVLSRGNLLILIGCLLFFLAFNLGTHSGHLDILAPIKKYVWIVGNGAFAAFTLSGAIAGLFLQRLSSKGKNALFFGVILVFAAVIFVFGFMTRPEWGISKIRATPAWIGYCTGIGLVAFSLFYWVVDLKQHRSWSKIIAPAGNSTLTCYLMPYVYYALLQCLDWSLPEFLRTGFIGLLKSLLFALLIVVVTGAINRFGIRLRL